MVYLIVYFAPISASSLSRDIPYLPIKPNMEMK
jgi:hypothetical protein